jgi:glycerophosphoryl diester phosphodiesterase
MMTVLPVSVALPRFKNDMTIARAQMATNGTMPPSKGLDDDIVTEMKICYIEYLIANKRDLEAEQVIEEFIYDDERMMALSEPYAAWLWLARMTLLIEGGNPSLSLGAAENALLVLSQHTGKKTEDFNAIVAALLYNLALAHHDMGDNSRAAKELTKAQQILERLTKRNEARFSAMLLMAVEASTEVIKSKTKQMNVLAHYQSASELYMSELNNGDANATRTAMSNLVEALGKEGDIMLEMGNSRNAVKYYTKALRYQKKLGEKMGHRDLQLSIGLAKALMRLINRRAAAEQLLRSLLPLAQRLDATAEAHEIQDLLNNKNKNVNIMTLLKSIFTAALIIVGTLGMQAQLIVGHRGSQWGVENTRAAFLNGIEAGAWGLECDIRVTADGTFVISHDDSYKRLGGPETKIASMSTQDVLMTPLTHKRHGITYAGTPCTLGEFLDICKQYNVVPVIEVKVCTNIHSNTKAENEPVFDGIPALINLIDQKGLTDKAVIISFMPGVVDFIHRHYSDITVQVLAGEEDGPIESWVDWCIERNMDLDVVHTIVTKEAVDRMHAAGLKVNVWTVDKPEDFERVKAAGVDFITTNARFPKEL